MDQWDKRKDEIDFGFDTSPQATYTENQSKESNETKDHEMQHLSYAIATKLSLDEIGHHVTSTYKIAKANDSIILRLY